METSMEANDTLMDLVDQGKTWIVQKIAAKEGRPNTFHPHQILEGRLTVLLNAEGTCFKITEPDGTFLRSSPVLGCGRTPEGVLLIETKNSIYRLTETV